MILKSLIEPKKKKKRWFLNVLVVECLLFMSSSERNLTERNLTLNSWLQELV